MHNDILYGSYVIKKIRSFYPGMEQQIQALSYAALYAARMNKKEFPDKYISLINGATIDSFFINQLYTEYRNPEGIEKWLVTKWDDNKVFIEKDGIRAYIKNQFIKNNYRLNADNHVFLDIPLMELYRQPGFIVRTGKLELHSGLLTRIYLNIKPVHANWVLGSLAKLLDRLAIPFNLKILAHPKMYLRCDACVVYVSSENLGRTIYAIKDSLNQGKINLMSRVPLMTKKIAEGIGIADDPSDISDDRISYGQWVSSLFLTNSLDITEPKNIAEGVKKSIIMVGRNPLHPYLRSNRTINMLFD